MLNNAVVVCASLLGSPVFAADFNQSLPKMPLLAQNHYELRENISDTFDPDDDYNQFFVTPSIPHYTMEFNILDPEDSQASYPPYLTIGKHKDWQYLKEQTYTIVGSGFAIVGIMTLLPESTTGWDSEARDLRSLENKWKDNVSAGPHWDSDDDYLNYVMHPYFGGVYYTASRHAGYDPYESTLYSFFISTFYWEYGIEAVAERPSYQDLIVTPIFGALAGEAMLHQEQAILANGGEVWGSEILGNISLFFLNPVGHIHHWISNAWGEDVNLYLTYHPQMVKLNAEFRF